MTTNSDSNQSPSGSVPLSPLAQAVAVGIADDAGTMASAAGTPVATSGNDTITVVSVSAPDVTIVETGGGDDSIEVVTVGGGNDTITINGNSSDLTPLTTTVAPAIGIDGTGTVVDVGGDDSSNLSDLISGGNDAITVINNGGSGLAPLTISVAPFIADGAEGSGPSSGGNDTITLDDGPGAGTDIIPGNGSFIPLEPGDAGFIDGSNGTLGVSVLGPSGGAADPAPAPDGGDPVSADIREAPIIIVDRPVDGPGNPPLGNGGGDAEQVPVRIGAPLPPLDPDDLLDAGLGIVEVSLPPAALMPPVVDVPPPVLDNGLTMIAQAVPAAGSDDSLTILAATA